MPDMERGDLPANGRQTVSRRAVFGATLGGIGAAAAVGVAAAAAWPDVKEAQAAAPGTGGSGGSATTDNSATIDFTAKPAADWKRRDPVLPPADPTKKTHDITITAMEVSGEIAPGTVQELWTFDGTVPGPIYRGKVGDQFNFTLRNEGKVGHSIDFHASKVAPNVEMRTINTGESLDYKYEAKHAGIWMYHCGTPPTLHHIAAGMHGAVIIDPPDLADVDHEFVLVQSEFYLGPPGQPGDFTKMQSDKWDAVVFNGYVNQYVHDPIRVNKNERVRIWVQNNGPSENCSFHIVGTIFDTVFKEGSYLLRPDDSRGGSQALDLQPAQGGFVECTFDVDGMYTFVTHKFSNVGKGAAGVFLVGDVDTTAAAGGH